MSPSVARISVAARLQDAMATYLLGLDRLDAGMIQSVFAADATVEHGGMEWHGRDIGETIVRAVKKTFRSSVHFMGNQTVRMDGSSPRAATTETYVVAHCVLLPPHDGRLIVRPLRYLDHWHLEARNRWTITERRTIREWDRLHPQVRVEVPA